MGSRACTAWNTGPRPTSSENQYQRQGLVNRYSRKSKFRNRKAKIRNKSNGQTRNRFNENEKQKTETSKTTKSTKSPSPKLVHPRLLVSAWQFTRNQQQGVAKEVSCATLVCSVQPIHFKNGTLHPRSEHQRRNPLTIVDDTPQQLEVCQWPAPPRC